MRGNPKTCTIIRDVDRWFACFSYNNNREKIANGRTVGIDVGIKNWITLSSGDMVDRPRFYDSAVGNTKKLQRNLSRKKKGSKNRKKARIRLAKAWRKVRLQREDYCHKITSDLSKRFQTMVFERLDIQEMVESSVACHKRQLTKNILDASWYKLKQLAAYKAEIVLIDPAGSTQKCSRCGFISEEKITLDVRTYECKNCGLVLDRDYNAAINIVIHVPQVDHSLHRQIIFMHCWILAPYQYIYRNISSTKLYKQNITYITQRLFLPLSNMQFSYVSSYTRKLCPYVQRSKR